MSLIDVVSTQVRREGKVGAETQESRREWKETKKQEKSGTTRAGKANVRKKIKTDEVS